MAQRKMIVTTTPDIQGRAITGYLGLVTGESILGANAVRDFFASVRDVVGGRSGSYEKVLKSAREARSRRWSRRPRRWVPMPWSASTSTMR